MGLFHQAVKEESKLRLAISGPSGSGKTYTSLAIASALANGLPFALIDTEHGSASKYADTFKFDVAEMHPPFHPEKFLQAIAEAQGSGYAVVIIDSISHAWAGSGGILDIVDEAAKRSKSGNTFTAWKEGTPIQNHLIDAIVQSGIHVIATMRSKTDYILVDNGNGRQAPKKVGMAPVQRDQFEYEFDVVLDMDVENNGIVTKSRCPALTGKVFAKPGRDVAGILSVWLTGEKPQQPQPQQAPQPAPAAPKQNGNGHAPEPTADELFDDMTSATQERAEAETHDSGTMATIDGAVAGKFSKWCEKFAEAYPSYRKNGTADKFHILKAVKAEKFDRITTENVTAVCDALKARAEAKVAAGSGK